MAKLNKGMAHLIIDGQSHSTNGEFTATIKNLEYEVTVDSDGKHWRSEKFISSIVSGSLITTDKLDIDTIVNGKDVVVQVELKNGQTAQLRDATFTGSAAVSAMDGTVEVEWLGTGKWIK